jgi:hypothetical protein
MSIAACVTTWLLWIGWDGNEKYNSHEGTKDTKVSENNYSDLRALCVFGAPG